MSAEDFHQLAAQEAALARAAVTNESRAHHYAMAAHYTRLAEAKEQLARTVDPVRPTPSHIDWTAELCGIEMRCPPRHPTQYQGCSVARWAWMAGQTEAETHRAIIQETRRSFPNPSAQKQSRIQTDPLHSLRRCVYQGMLLRGRTMAA